MLCVSAAWFEITIGLNVFNICVFAYVDIILKHGLYETDRNKACGNFAEDR